MISLPDLKEDMMQYKATRDNVLFASILANVDYLIVYFINRLRRNYVFLQQMDMMELYHTSILALNSAILSMPEDWKPCYIPCRLRSYMLAEFRRTYSYLIKEINLDHTSYYTTKRYTTLDTNKIDYKSLLDLLDKDDAYTLDNYVMKTKSVSEMARERHRTPGSVSLDIKRIKRILREKVRRKNELNEIPADQDLQPQVV